MNTNKEEKMIGGSHYYDRYQYKRGEKRYVTRDLVCEIFDEHYNDFLSLHYVTVDGVVKAQDHCDLIGKYLIVGSDFHFTTQE